MIFCTVFNPALDALFRLPELTPGKTYMDVSASIQPAGKGINVAQGVKSLGEDVCVIGLMPQLDMLKFSYHLDTHGIPSYFFPIDGSVRINATIAEEKNRCVTHINAKDFIVSQETQTVFLEFLKAHMSNGDFWGLCGSLPHNCDNDTYTKTIHFCKEVGISVLLDTRAMALSMGIRGKPHMVKPNLVELESFFNEQIHGIHHIALKGKRLIDSGIEYVFITLGEDGMIALHKNDCLLCCPPKIEARDTVGCGDAVVSAILVAKKRKYSFADTCKFAIACGTSKALHIGPGIIKKDEVWHFMEKVRVEAV